VRQSWGNEMLDAGLLDPVMEAIDREGLRLTGSGGFLPELVKALLERGLATELTEHLGYEKGDPAGRGSPNSRNGSTPKTVASEIGDVRLDVPRDRMGSFEPRLVPKGSRRCGLDEMIISLYAGGITVRGNAQAARSAPSCPMKPSPRSPTWCLRRSRPGSLARWRRSTRSSTSMRRRVRVQ
jgi:hypothetical protein